MRLLNNTIGITKRLQVGSSDLAVLSITTLLVLPLLVVLSLDFWTMAGRQKSIEYVQTERATLVLSCTALPEGFARKWATLGWSLTLFPMREELASGELGGNVKDCVVVGIGTDNQGPELTQNTSKKNSGGKRN